MTSKPHTELVAAVRAGINGDTGYTKPEVFKDAYAALESLEEQLEAAQLPEELTCGSCGLRIRGSAVIYCPRDHCPPASNPAKERQ